MWDLMVQTMDPEQEDSLDFDPLDSTKLWPEARIFCFMCVFSLFRILECIDYATASSTSSKLAVM